MWETLDKIAHPEPSRLPRILLTIVAVLIILTIVVGTQWPELFH